MSVKKRVRDFKSVVQLRLHISGRVQGVGFRPFVYQLAQSLQLFGSVANTTQGVVIDLQGTLQAIEQFQKSLCAPTPETFPKQVRIDRIETQWLSSPECADQAGAPEFSAFAICDSKPDSTTKQTTQISPDLALCDGCLQEFHDPSNRRYHDPFINCSDCGPRYSILAKSPYDRANTAMQPFALCDLCSAEYHEPGNRRFHTQGICCPECGPTIHLYSDQQQLLSQGAAAIKQVAQHLNSAGLVAVKGLGGFHIVCDATNPAAVAKLRQRKQRVSKPFAVLCKDLSMAEGLAELSVHETTLLNSDAKPIVLVTKRNNSILCDGVAPNINRLGLFLAYTPLQHRLFYEFDRPLIATSANVSGEPILYQKSAVFAKLCPPDSSMVDLVLDYDRDIVNPCDDSIMQSVHGKPVVLRLGRGLAPYYQNYQTLPLRGDKALDKPMDKLQTPTRLAVGAQQKSSIAYAHAGQMILSPFIGDLGGLSANQRFQETIERLGGLHQSKPAALVSDLHTGYASRQWAESYAVQSNGLQHRSVQHHYAHVLAAMAEFQLSDRLLAFSWDGTGLGDDGTLWGGEVLLADRHGYQRLRHLKPFKLLGGDQANQQPRRVALALLFDQRSFHAVLALDLSTVHAFTPSEMALLYQMHQQNINSPLCSSMGRLFDAVASLCGLIQTLDYEGQSGLLMEAIYDKRITDAYDFDIKGDEIELTPMLDQLLDDQLHGVAASVMVSRFMNLCVNLIEQLSDECSDLDVVVTGGVFQNKTLLALLDQRFSNKPQRLYFQQQTPMNDGSIALGQLWQDSVVESTDTQ